MKTNTKRVLSILLVMVMILGLFSTTLMASSAADNHAQNSSESIQSAQETTDSSGNEDNGMSLLWLCFGILATVSAGGGVMFFFLKRNQKEHDGQNEQADKKKKRIVRMVIIATLAVIILIILSFLLLRGYSNKIEVYTSQLIDMDTIEREPTEWLPQSNFSFNATLLISDGPGTPEGVNDPSKGNENSPYTDKLESSSKEISDEQARLSRKYNPDPYTGKLESTASEIMQAERNLRISRDAILNVGDFIKIKNPKTGSVLEAGTDFTLEWDTVKSIVSNKPIKISILFSADGGKSYKVISDWMDDKNEYKLIVPDAVSNNCIFRIQVSKVGEEEIYVGVNSSVFSIVESKIKINNISDIITIKSPNAGMTLDVGTEFILSWDTKKVEHSEISKVNILFSADGGKNYKEISGWMDNKTEYRLIVPDEVSETCVFRIQVNAIGASKIHGGVNSATFKITATTESTTEKPKFTDKAGTFISSQSGDSVRWLKVDHQLNNVDRVIWQIGKIDFPDNVDDPFDVPGLLVSGELSGSTEEFKIDFDAVYKGVDAGEAPKDNGGEDFTVKSGAVQLGQSEYNTSMRVLLLDKDGNIIGGATFNSTVGDSYVVAHAADVMTINPFPVMKTTVPILPDGVSDVAPREFPAGIALFTGGETTWKIYLRNIPREVRDPEFVELQVSTVPFSTYYPLYYTRPAGLVYSNKIKRDMTSSGSKVFDVPFGDFAPSKQELGKNTVTYYVRAVMFYCGTKDKIYTPQEVRDGMWDGKTLVALATKGDDTVYYTGDKSFYESQNSWEVFLGTPEEVKVKSNIPITQVTGYVPPIGRLNNPEEYFEVTRRITADEWGFWLTNTVTGEKLNPYDWHKKNENMTKEEYQKKLDRMVPIGASFHVKPASKNWFESFISDFVDLFTQIYDGIKNAYNGLKSTLVGALAEGFGTVFGGKAFFEKVFTVIADFGLIYIGLPPSLPNADILALDGIDYIVRVALDEAAKSMGVPLDDLPIDVRNQIVTETQNQFKNLRTGKQNPFNVDYLRYSTYATGRVPVVYVEIVNYAAIDSTTGTMSIYIDNVTTAWKSESMYIPSLKPGETLRIPIYLKRGTMNESAYQRLKDNDPSIGTLTFHASVKYNTPDILEAAKKQGVTGTDPNRPDQYVWDRNPNYYYSRTSFILMEKLYRGQLAESRK